MTLGRPPDQDIVVVGATGDLARRKLLPALYDLYDGGLLPLRGSIVGYARSKGDDATFRELARKAVHEGVGGRFRVRTWERFARRLHFVSGAAGGFEELARRCSLPRRLVYLSIPPSAFEGTVASLAEAGLVEGTRLVVEKPFGRDYASACALTESLQSVFDESQVFRIDHYLGKETVQNILVFRFGNSLFERIWSRDAIDHVQFTVAESLGMEGRGAFYEETGALRDILQNHVFQVLSLLTMEPPSLLDAEGVRDEKAKLFHAMRPLVPGDVVRGQYTGARVNGRRVTAYRQERGVARDSDVETFAALRLAIDNWRWAGVPFFLRTGKRLPQRTTEVTVVFKEAPVRFFEGTGVDALKPNVLTIRIQPDEGISLQFLAKEPGTEVRVRPVTMWMGYSEEFRVRPAEAYERLLHDAMDGDQMLFARSDSVERAWEVVEPVLRSVPPLASYPAGTWGPEAAAELIAPRLWHLR